MNPLVPYTVSVTNVQVGIFYDFLIKKIFACKNITAIHLNSQRSKLTIITVLVVKMWDTNESNCAKMDNILYK